MSKWVAFLIAGVVLFFLALVVPFPVLIGGMFVVGIIVGVVLDFTKRNERGEYYNDNDQDYYDNEPNQMNEQDMRDFKEFQEWKRYRGTNRDQ